MSASLWAAARGHPSLSGEHVRIAGWGWEDGTTKASTSAWHCKPLMTGLTQPSAQVWIMPVPYQVYMYEA